MAPLSRLFPVCCVEEVPTLIVDQILDEAHAGFERLASAPNSPESFAVLGRTDDIAPRLKDTSHPSTFPIPQSFESPFVGHSPEQVLNALAGATGSKNSHSRAVLIDARSIDDFTVMIAERDPQGVVKTMRATFYAVELVMASLETGTGNFEEMHASAQKTAGVYRLQLPAKKG